MDNLLDDISQRETINVSVKSVTQLGANAKQSGSLQKNQGGRFMNLKDNSLTQVKVYEDMSIIPHHAVNSHFSNLDK